MRPYTPAGLSLFLIIILIAFPRLHYSSASNSSTAALRSTAGLGSDSGTKASLPGGFVTYSPRISANFFFPIIFSDHGSVRGGKNSLPTTVVPL